MRGLCALDRGRYDDHGLYLAHALPVTDVLGKRCRERAVEERRDVPALHLAEVRVRPCSRSSRRTPRRPPRATPRARCRRSCRRCAASIGTRCETGCATPRSGQNRGEDALAERHVSADERGVGVGVHCARRCHASASQRWRESGEQAEQRARADRGQDHRGIPAGLKHRHAQHVDVQAGHPRGQDVAQQHAHDAAGDGDREREQQVVHEDVHVAVAQRLGQADLAPLRLHETRERDRQAEHRDRKDERRHDRRPGSRSARSPPGARSCSAGRRAGRWRRRRTASSSSSTRPITRFASAPGTTRTEMSVISPLRPKIVSAACFGIHRIVKLRSSGSSPFERTGNMYSGLAAMPTTGTLWVVVPVRTAIRSPVSSPQLRRELGVEQRDLAVRRVPTRGRAR